MIEKVRLPFFALSLLVAAGFSPAIAQTQYSIGNPTDEQQEMLELINRARADGGAEAARLGLSGLQEGPPSIGGQVFMIANTAQPLSWNPLLATCAQNQAKILNDSDQFFLGVSPHFFGGKNPEQRISDAGYPMNLAAEYNGPKTAGGFVPGPENVAENLSSGSGAFTGLKLIMTILTQHDELFTDQTVPGRGHRMSTMLTYWREIGIGVTSGSDNGQGRIWDSLYTVQNFGTQTNSTPFITGVVYSDANGNGFYDPGEGIGGIRVDVAGSNFFAISSASGGYSVPVPGDGSYSVTFSGGGRATTQRTVNVANSLNAKVDLLAGPPVPTLLANVSTRLPVGADPKALIAGFILTGTQPKKVIIRAVGPSLPLHGRLNNPTLELFQGSTLLAANDDWKNQPAADRQAVIDSTIPPTNDLEPALVRTLPANGAAYTAVVRGLNNAGGIAVVEVYDLDRTADSRLANISTRGFVQTGNDVLIAGMIVLGPGPQKVIVRAIGPSLTLPGKMLNPTLELRDGNGAVVRSNDNWQFGGQEAEIIASTVPPTSGAESALVETLAGNGASYTAIVRGVNNTTGIAVVEVYALN